MASSAASRRAVHVGRPATAALRGHPRSAPARLVFVCRGRDFSVAFGPRPYEARPHLPNDLMGHMNRRRAAADQAEAARVQLDAAAALAANFAVPSPSFFGAQPGLPPRASRCISRMLVKSFNSRWPPFGTRRRGVHLAQSFAPFLLRGAAEQRGRARDGRAPITSSSQLTARAAGSSRAGPTDEHQPNRIRGRGDDSRHTSRAPPHGTG